MGEEQQIQDAEFSLVELFETFATKLVSHRDLS